MLPLPHARGQAHCGLRTGHCLRIGGSPHVADVVPASVVARAALCVVALLAASVCAAQNGAGASAAGADGTTDKAVNVVFRAVGFDGSSSEPEAFVYVEGGGRIGSMEEAVRVPAFRRSAPYRHSGSPVLSFYRQAQLRDAVTAAGGNTAAALAALPPVGQVRIPGDASRVLLLFIPAAQGRYQIVALDDDEQSFAAGTARVFNATNQTLALRFMDDAPTLIAPGATAAARGNGVNVRMQIAWRPQNVWEIVASPMFALRPTQRRTVFLTFSDADYFRLEGLDGALLEGAPLQVFTIVE